MIISKQISLEMNQHSSSAAHSLANAVLGLLCHPCGHALGASAGLGQAQSSSGTAASAELTSKLCRLGNCSWAEVF